MRQKYESPGCEKKAFTCPECSTYSQHNWEGIGVEEASGDFRTRFTMPNEKTLVNTLWLCKCQSCGYISFWYKDKLAWPLNSSVEAPLEEMPDDIKNLYNEARSIVESSPKGACAILRLAMQKLCNRLAGQEENKKLDGAIKKLVEKGLPTTLQKAMDTVRIVGGEAVHPGEIIIDDNKELAEMMFRLMNIIIEKIIIEPNVIDRLYETMPASKLEGVKNRDKNN